MTKVLFVCVGNSCRSQMAEAIAKRRGEGKVETWSAGSSPLGWIAPFTYTVMEEKGFSLQGQWSKRLKDVPAAEMDVVVTMGFEVSCPLPSNFKGRRVEWQIPDPFGAGVDVYRDSRDLIEDAVRELLCDIQAPKDKKD